jgi:hypothetical protein
MPPDSKSLNIPIWWRRFFLLHFFSYEKTTLSNLFKTSKQSRQPLAAKLMSYCRRGSRTRRTRTRSHATCSRPRSCLFCSTSESLLIEGFRFAIVLPAPSQRSTANILTLPHDDGVGTPGGSDGDTIYICACSNVVPRCPRRSSCSPRGGGTSRSSGASRRL